MSNNDLEAKNSKYKITRLEDTILNENEKIHKVIIIGDSAVGKTSLSYMATKGLFLEQSKATIGFDIFNYVAKINDVIIKLQIWDTCGLEEFNSCTTSLYKDASLAIVVYSIVNHKTFDNVPNWVNLVKKHASPETLIFLVGNKSDLENERQVSKEDCKQIKEEQKFEFFTETSAKDNIYVQELFQEAIIHLYEKYKLYENEGDKKKEDLTQKKEKTVLNKNNHQKNKKRKIC